MTTSPPRDGRLWWTALGLSLLLNLGLMVLVGWVCLRVDLLPQDTELVAPPSEAVATIYLEAVEPEPVASPAPEAEKRFTRTSPDQEQAEPDRETNRIGERSTRATSDRAADPSAAALPSQEGVEPKDEQDIETTESDYRDGALSETDELAPVAANPPAPLAQERPSRKQPESVVASPSEQPGEDEQVQLPPPRERLLEGPNPVDVEVPVKVSDENIPERRAKKTQPVVESPPEPDAVLPEPVVPTPVPAERFSGFQRKTAVVGSISLSGRSALNVDDSELGRYQASISRAVEQEWQRNCVRHRDFITPGFLTVRFFVEASGKVRSVQFVGDMQTGEVQKGFTLNAIRDADIPAMPDQLKQVYDDDPLELTFRFYF